MGRYIGLIIVLLVFTKLEASTDSLALRSLEALDALEVKLSSQYEIEKQAIYTDLEKLELLQLKASSKRKQIRLLKQELALKDQLRILEKSEVAHISEIRFKKGIEILKLIYEKILSLQHHFAVLDFHQSISNITNPNSYPAYRKERENLIKEKKEPLDLPNFTTGNPILSTASFLVGKYIVKGKKDEQVTEEVACILDFTIRMYDDLNTIYYETEFLKGKLKELNTEIVDLFGDYTDPVDYKVDLVKCRDTDDWDELEDKIESFGLILEEKSKNKDATVQRQAFEMQADLEFSIDRLLSFINQYTDFVKEGTQYYEKFAIIAKSYENEEACSEHIPKQFEKLRTDITYSIDRFKQSYNIAEIKGSKLKDLMYGVK